MISQKQLEANRRNAQRSTGPRTEEGKRVSALNARRHNLTGQVTAMTDADRIMHDAFSAAIVESLAPEGAMETQLAQRVATDSWRGECRSNGQALSPRCAGEEGISGQRISAVEDNLFALGHNAKSDDIETEDAEIHAALTAAKVFQEESKQLQLLTLYEQRINRGIQKNLATLQALQAARLAKREAEMKEAKKLLQLSEMKGLPYEPGRDGFVFSNAEIRAAIDKDRRLNRAYQTDFSRYKPQKLHANAA
jgi:hypothetical protein